MHADHRAVAPERQHDDPQLLQADQVLRIAPVEGIETGLVQEDQRPGAGLPQPAGKGERAGQHQPEDLALDGLAVASGGERLALRGAQHPAQRERPGDLHLRERQLPLLDLPEEGPQRLPRARRREESLHAVVALESVVEARVERRRSAPPVAQVEAGVALGVRAQPVQTLQGLRNHVLRGVPSRELGRGGDVEQQRLLQSKLQLRVRQAADAAGGQRREHGGAYRPAPPATLKYVASGWWKTTAETLASGSIMQPSVSSTPISSGRRTRKRIC